MVAFMACKMHQIDVQLKKTENSKISDLYMVVSPQFSVCRLHVYM